MYDGTYGNHGSGKQGTLDSGIEKTQSQRAASAAQCFDAECSSDEKSPRKIPIRIRKARRVSSSSSSSEADIVSAVKSKITVTLPHNGDECVFVKRDRLKANFPRKGQHLNKHTDKNENKIDQLAQHLRELENNIKKLTSYTDNLEMQLTNEREINACLRQDVVRLDSECQHLKKQLDSSKREIHGLQENCEKLAQDSEERQSMSRKDEHRLLKTLHEELNASQATSQKLDDHIERNDRNISQLHSNNQQLSNIMHELNSSVQILKSDMMTAIADLKGEIEDTRKAIHSTSGEFNTSGNLFSSTKRNEQLSKTLFATGTSDSGHHSHIKSTQRDNLRSATKNGSCNKTQPIPQNGLTKNSSPDMIRSKTRHCSRNRQDSNQSFKKPSEDFSFGESKFQGLHRNHVTEDSLRRDHSKAPKLTPSPPSKQAKSTRPKQPFAGAGKSRDHTCDLKEKTITVHSNVLLSRIYDTDDFVSMRDA